MNLKTLLVFISNIKRLAAILSWIKFGLKFKLGTFCLEVKDDQPKIYYGAS